MRVTTTEEQDSITSFTQRSATFRTCFAVTEDAYRAHLGGEEVDRRPDTVRSVENSLAMSIVEEGERQRLDRVVRAVAGRYDAALHGSNETGEPVVDLAGVPFFVGDLE